MQDYEIISTFSSAVYATRFSFKVRFVDLLCFRSLVLILLLRKQCKRRSKEDRSEQSDVTKQIICSPVVLVWDGAVCFLNSTAMIPNIEMTPLWRRTMSHLPPFSRHPVAAAWTCRETTTHVTPPGSSGSMLSGQILLIHSNFSFLFFLYFY